MNFLERVLSNYFLAWSQIFNYKDKTSRIPFWHFFILDGLIGALVSILSNNSLVNDPNDFYSIAEGYEWSYIYSIPSFLVFLALLVRRLRDIGKENLVLWTFCSFIPFYNLYIFSQPSSKQEMKLTQALGSDVEKK
ncbi:DUF805 domain-containing protein [Prochlorococcus marinus]|uniref:DUF805 domain-containing protein n=1 Tax=Prochlorococcus marinus TaxID=1219 RepID=UPI0022B2B6C3|nr:DUF805 domain-containing protein [Prochlorococcus marinus]